MRNRAQLKSHRIDTPLGPMIAIGDEEALCSLEFEDCQREPSSIVLGRNRSIDSIERELDQYFKGQLERFVTPIKMRGTSFQEDVWSELMKIPFGKTRSYSDIAEAIENPGAVRAVGSANGANLLTIVIPCHRVINASGKIGGYGGGLDRKEWLLQHEVKYAKRS